MRTVLGSDRVLEDGGRGFLPGGCLPRGCVPMGVCAQGVCVCVGRSMLDLESWASGLFPLGVTFCPWIFLFSRSKASDANIGIIANVVYL